VEEYALAFENLQFEVSMHNDGFDDTFFVSQFVKGLRTDIGTGVQAHVPRTVDQAVLLAKRQQFVLDKGKQQGSRSSTQPRFQSTTQKSEGKSTGHQSSLWKEQQTLNYRKANNLCYYCGDKFDPAHITVCTQGPKAQANAMVVNDLDMPLTEEILSQLELEDSIAADFGQLSLNAIAGTDIGHAMKIKALVHNKVMLTLIDSGSSHSFVSSAFLNRLGITPVPAPPKQVKLPNGEILLSDHMVPNFCWWSSGHTLHTDLRVLDMTTYDAILGYDWLKPHSPMICDGEARTLEFQEHGKTVKLQGMCPAQQTIPPMSAKSLVKSYQANDIWAMVLVTHDDSVSSECPPESVQHLLHKYKDVFDAPQALPPTRIYDHTIPLVPGAVPVNAKPYRYSPHHKDEIERQKEMLFAGLVVPSTSPFASLVLLIQKKDGSWRFCVDYRRLNDLTIKNRFPMPIIEEILEELAGSKYFSKLDMTSVIIRLG
jgi:hypothetical protein